MSQLMVYGRTGAIMVDVAQHAMQAEPKREVVHAVTLHQHIMVKSALEMLRILHLVMMTSHVQV